MDGQNERNAALPHADLRSRSAPAIRMRRRLVALILLAALAGLLIWAITSGTLAASTTIYQADAVALSAHPKVPVENPPAASKVDDPILAQSLATLYAELTKLSAFLTAYRFNGGHPSSQVNVTHSSGGSSLKSSDYVSRMLFSAQTDATHDSFGRAVSGLSNRLSESLTTDLLTVSGNGTVSGTLAVTGALSSDAHLSAPYFTATSDTATSTFLGALTVGTSTASAAFTLDGAAYLAPISAPATTADRLYNVSGDLYWAGSVIGGATTGQWTTDGTDVWRAGGNVGVGTSTPTTKLAIESSSGWDQISMSETSSGGIGNAFLGIRDDTTNMYSLWGVNRSSQTGVFSDPSRAASNIILNASNASSFISFYTGSANNTPATERMRIDKDGNIGIGETAPASKLSVSGGGSFGAAYDMTAAPTNGLIVEGNVGVGTTTPAAKLTVQSSSAGVVTQAIQTVSDQTANAFQIANASGTPYVTVSCPQNSTTGCQNTFKVDATNSTGGSTAARAMQVTQNVNAPGNSNGASVSIKGIASYTTNGHNLTGSNTNLELQTFTGGGGTISTVNGITYQLFGGAGTITNATLANLSLVSNAGSIGTLYGLRINTPTSAGTIGVNYGIYIADQVGATTNYSIYSAGGQNYFAGNTGIGATTPTAQLHTTGSVRFANFGAGTLETYANGNLSVSSDESLKANIKPFARSIDDLLKVEPISFRWREASGMDTENTYTGFSAQNVAVAIPEAVGTNPNGKLTLSDRPILAALVNAVKDLHGRITELADTVREFGHSFTTERLCVEDVCVTRAQFLQMVEHSSQTPLPAPLSASETDSGEDDDVPAGGGSTSSRHDAEPASRIEPDEAPTGPAPVFDEVAEQPEVSEEDHSLEDTPAAEPEQADLSDASLPDDAPDQ
jgi:hypothetical protein